MSKKNDRRGDGKAKGERLAPGNPRRVADAKCAWRGMTDEQRREHLAWLADEYEPLARLRALAEQAAATLDEDPLTTGHDRRALQLRRDLERTLRETRSAVYDRG